MKTMSTFYTTLRSSRPLRKYIAKYIDDGIDLLFVDGHDNAIVGLLAPSQGTGNVPKVVYDAIKIKKNLIADGMTEEEAMEFVEVNIADAYMGENTPVFSVHLTDTNNGNDGFVETIQAIPEVVEGEAKLKAKKVVVKKLPSSDPVTKRKKP